MARETANHSARGLHWVFTINNPTDDDRAQLQVLADSDALKGMIYQKEVGENGTPHFQGYICLKRKLRRAQMSKHLTRAWLDIARSPKDAIEYCRKGETRVEGPWEFGTLELKTKGKRSDLEKLHSTLRTGTFDDDLLHDEFFPLIVKYSSGLRTAMMHYVPDRAHRTQLHILYGPPDAGKTWMAMHMYDPPLDTDDPPPNPRTFKMNICRGDPWFDGYDPMKHDFVVFDEYHGEIAHKRFLEMIDEYQSRVECKGGFIKWRAKHVVLTMNEKPYVLYKKTWGNPQHVHAYEAFWRRVTTLTHVKSRDNWISHNPVEWSREKKHKMQAVVDAETRSERRAYRDVQPAHEPRIVEQLVARSKPKNKRRAPTPELDKRQRTLDDYIE